MGEAGLVSTLEPVSVRKSLENGHRVRAAQAVAMITVAVLVIATLSLLTDPDIGDGLFRAAYQKLYVLPVFYAAWVFGRRGGLSVSLIVAVLLPLESWLAGDWQGISSVMLVDVVSYPVLGYLIGVVRDAQAHRADEVTRVTHSLESANERLERRALRISEIQAHTTSILSSIKSGVITVERDGSITTANPAAERILGMNSSRMIGQQLASLFREPDELLDDVRRILSGRVPITRRDETLVTVGGQTVHAHIITSRMRAVGGTVLGVVVTFEDISEVRALTDQLIRADRLAAMGELTAGVAHEVRNPLGIIRASVQLLEDAQCDPRRTHEAAEVIKQEIDRLDKVVKALLDFGRPSPPSIRPLALREVVEDVALFTDRFARGSNVDIRLEFAEDIPQVYGDPDQLKQVFLNLISNAIQAMGEDGGRITVRGHANQDYVVIEVEDSGPGIPQGIISRVFDPFFTSRTEGTGLGLTIVHRIIDDHDGHIEVENTAEGARFTVFLPSVMTA